MFNVKATGRIPSLSKIILLWNAPVTITCLGRALVIVEDSKITEVFDLTGHAAFSQAGHYLSGDDINHLKNCIRGGKRVVSEWEHIIYTERASRVMRAEAP